MTEVSGQPSPAGMDDDGNWKSEYEQRYDQLVAEAERRLADERRRFPRHKLHLQTDALVSGPPHRFRIFDISVGGVSFTADRNFTMGTRLWVTAGNLVAVEVEVVEAFLVEDDPDFLDYSYRVKARFVEEMDGYMAFVLFWDRDRPHEAEDDA